MAINRERAESFLENIETTFSNRHIYRPAPYLKPLESREPLYLPSIRSNRIALLLNDETLKAGDMLPHAYFSEWATYRAIAKAVSNAGYRVDMAPTELEQGQPGRKGIDIVISPKIHMSESIPLLGINVKLSNKGRDHHFFDPLICAPAMNLNLGRWEIKTREEESTGIRGWMHQIAVPSIGRSGKIPHMDPLKKYIFSRVRKTLDLYLDKASGMKKITNNENNLLPQAPEDFDIFMEKLEESQILFNHLS